MMKNQHEHTEIPHQRLLVALQEQKPGNVLDFRRFQPTIFSGMEKPLDVEQCLVDTTDLLKVTRVPDKDSVEVAKVQLTNVVRTWWLAEEMRLEKPITWDQFSKDFYERFFPVNSSEKDEGTIYQIAVGESNGGQVCYTVLKA